MIFFIRFSPSDYQIATRATSNSTHSIYKYILVFFEMYYLSEMNCLFSYASIFLLSATHFYTCTLISFIIYIPVTFG